MNANNFSLQSLKRKYSKGIEIDSLFAFQDAHKRYLISKQQSLIDLTVTAANLTPQIFFEHKNIDPLIEKAIKETNPNLDPSTLSSLSDHELTGILNTAKGKYFEYLVTDKLNSGETVGDLHLPEGYQAVMASSVTQPGWDIKILDDHGHLSDYLQLKATNSLSYIHATLERYPDITILSTDEVAERANGLVLDSGISEDMLREQVSSAINDLEPSVTDDFLEAFNPLMPLVFILASEGYRLSIGEHSITTSINSARFRAERSITASGVGSLVYALGGGWLTLPATFIGGAIYDNYRQTLLASDSLDKFTTRLKTYRLHQQEQTITGGGYGVVF